MSAPLLTVVTVVFNGATQIARTIESVLEQDCALIEYVVIDGGSRDGTLSIVDRYRDRIHTIVSEPDRGIYDAMNKGVRAATGEFLLFMNCGDVFAGPGAASAALREIRAGTQQVAFGGWVRRAEGNADTPCRPDLARGLFNHQATIYSRAIHAWHGDYLSIRGLTTADYLFFATLFDSPRVECRVLGTTLAVIDVSGVSAGLQTLSQKFAADYLCGRTSRVRLVAILALHPLYSTLKTLWRRFR
ncbi:MAG: glycosyltransferase family 2 protein [Betaproteobacteria bacterium]